MTLYDLRGQTSYYGMNVSLLYYHLHTKFGI